MNQDINKIVNSIKKDLHNSIDLKTRYLNVKNKKIAYLYLESVCSSDTISSNIIKCLTFEINQNKNKIFDTFYRNIKNTITSSNMLIVTNYNKILYLLSSGFTIIILENENKAIALETRRDLSRGITESSSESIIRGPKDSFTETHATNLGLIRKRIKDQNLVMEDVFLGKRTTTKIHILPFSNDVHARSGLSVLIIFGNTVFCLSIKYSLMFPVSKIASMFNLLSFFLILLTLSKLVMS